MAKYSSYVGVTETRDPGLCWMELKKLHRSNVIITKHLENPDFRSWLLEHQKCIILHATITGWGGTPVEPGVISYQESIDYLKELLKDGFPANQVVLRVDPVIPNTDGFNKLVDVVHKYALIQGPVRVRLSMLDNYMHIRRKMQSLGVDMSMYQGFRANDQAFNHLNELICKMKKEWQHLEFESCAEPLLTSCQQLGCVSQKDIDILGLTGVVRLEGKTHQRRDCLCPDNKLQLTGGWNIPTKCSSKCAYCYVKSNHG